MRDDLVAGRSFVGIESLIGTRLSTGPRERGSTYDLAILDVEFLMRLLQDHPRLRAVYCVPDWTLCVRHGTHGLVLAPSRPCDGDDVVLSIRAGVLVTGLGTDSPRLWFPPTWQTSLATCRQNGTRFAIANFGLYTDDELDLGHANGLVFDLKHRRIERFEPAGPTEHDRLIRDLFQRRMPGWQYVDTSLPLQTQRTDSYHGMCVSFVIDFFLHRLLNPNLTSLAVQHMMLRTPAQETRKRILRLNATVLDRIAERESGRTLPEGS
jgi:hypothetical protein